jgi:hypothetical protein
VTGPAGGSDDAGDARPAASSRDDGPRSDRTDASTADLPGGPAHGSGASPAERTGAEREAARLRWELARLHSRRSVRAALLATETGGARRGGAGDVLATLRGRRIVEDLDVIAPVAGHPRMPYPHLDVVHLAVDPVFGAAAPHRRIAPDGARVTPDGGAGIVQSPDAVRVQPPDLVVLDDLDGLARWPTAGRRALREALPAAGAVVGLVTSPADAAEAAMWPLDLLLVGPDAERVDGVTDLLDTVDALPLLPGIDPRADNPVGWRRRPARPAVVAGAAGSPVVARLSTDLGLPLVTSAAAATDAGAAIVAAPHGWEGTRQVLALAARGIPVIVAADTGVPHGPDALGELGGLDSPGRLDSPGGLGDVDSLGTLGLGFLNGLVETARSERLLAAATAWSDDLDVRERHSVRLRRTVLRDHTHRRRLETVLTRLGVPTRRPERISVLLATRRPDHLRDAVAQIAAQDHPDVELVAALHGDGFEDDAEAQVAAWHTGPARVVRVDGAAPLGDVLNAALDEATGTLVAKMDDDDLYGPGHLSDLLVALEYSGADVVGRWANETHLVDADVTIAQDLDREERWAHHLPGATMLVRGDVLRSVRFRRVPRHVDTQLLRSIHAAGGAAYATHRFGFVRRRHGDHTYDPGDARFDAATGTDGALRARPGLDRSVLEV